MLNVITDTLVDAVKLLPFLFVTYLLMEYIERKSGDAMSRAVKKAGHFGPLIGGVLGVFPQCGFSAAASNLYAGRVISMGTLIAIYLSTSDEMLPILISEKADVMLILKILAMKAIIGIIFGFITDAAVHIFKKDSTGPDIGSLCEREHCSCDEEEGIVRPALVHTVHIFAFVIIITFAINILMEFMGENVLRSLISGCPVVGEMIAGLIGLIPNCAASVVITQLYLEGLLPLGSMMTGLLVSAGVGLLVLFRVNKDVKENLSIVAVLYFLGVLGGCIIEFSGISI